MNTNIIIMDHPLYSFFDLIIKNEIGSIVSVDWCCIGT